MNEFVLDCSATLPWAFQHESTNATDALQSKMAHGAKAWVPALWHLEVANALMVAKRRGRVEEAWIDRFFFLLASYDIEIDPETVAFAWTKTLGMAENFKLSVYDAAYLELALRRGLPLASLDRPLCAAMKAAGGELIL